MNLIKTYRRLRAEADERSRIAKSSVPTRYRFGLGPVNCFSQYHIAPDTRETVVTHWFAIDRYSVGLTKAQSVWTNDDKPIRFALDFSRGVRAYGGRYCLMLTRARASKVTS